MKTFKKYFCTWFPEHILDNKLLTLTVYYYGFLKTYENNGDKFV